MSGSVRRVGGGAGGCDPCSAFQKSCPGLHICPRPSQDRLCDIREPLQKLPSQYVETNFITPPHTAPTPYTSTSADDWFACDGGSALI